jgi:hypothetical protein
MSRNERQSDYPVTRIHRRALRALSMGLLKKAHEQLVGGRNEGTVCSILKVSPRVMRGALRPALEEVLWERGYFSN